MRITLVGTGRMSQPINAVKGNASVSSTKDWHFRGRSSPLNIGEEWVQLGGSPTPGIRGTPLEREGSHYEPDRSALKKKEWERRTQEVQQDEDLFSSGFNLFGEPYKTNKGDALANRVQNTLGNYDEMKDFLSNHSSQSHLVGIPKNSVPQTPVDKAEQQSFFPDGPRNRLAPSHQGVGHVSSASSMPPPSAVTLAGSAVLHGHQSNKKSRSAEWSRGNHSSSTGQSSQTAGQQCSRAKHTNSAHEAPQSRYEDLFTGQADLHKGDSSPASTSSRSRRHGHSSKSAAGDITYKESNHSKSPTETDFSNHGSGSPVPSTSLICGSLSAPNFPPGLHSKPSTVQQKPTAYVRPMDGQDQVPNDSPELKAPVEIGDTCSNPNFGGLLEGKPSTANTKSKLPKLTLPQSGEQCHVSGAAVLFLSTRPRSRATACCEKDPKPNYMAKRACYSRFL
ncbi:AFF2 protein, partial [Polypterus senegalus]